MKHAMIAVLLAAATAGASLPAAAVSPPHAYLVMPFENTGEDPSLDWLSTGLAHTLGEYITGFGRQAMDDEERSVLLEGNGIPPGAPIALASALELGRKSLARPAGLRTDRMVLGRFNVENGEILLAVRVIDLQEEKARPWLSRSGRLKDLLAVHRELAVAMARDEKISLPDSRVALLRKPAEDVPLLAFETYCRAMAESDSKKRVQLLRKAMQEYPGYPKAAYEAGVLLAREERWDEAASVLSRASSDPFPFESEYHLLSALVALKRKDPQGAVSESRQALSIADTARGHLLLGRALLASGDRQAAVTELEKARAADPSDTEIEQQYRAVAEGKPEGGPP